MNKVHAPKMARRNNQGAYAENETPKQVRCCRACPTVSRPSMPSRLEGSRRGKLTRFANFVPSIFALAILRIRFPLHYVPVHELVGVSPSARRYARQWYTRCPLFALSYIVAHTRKDVPINETASAADRRYKSQQSLRGPTPLIPLAIAPNGVVPSMCSHGE